MTFSPLLVGRKPKRTKKKKIKNKNKMMIWKRIPSTVVENAMEKKIIFYRKYEILGSTRCKRYDNVFHRTGVEERTRNGTTVATHPYVQRTLSPCVMSRRPTLFFQAYTPSVVLHAGHYCRQCVPIECTSADVIIALLLYRALSSRGVISVTYVHLSRARQKKGKIEHVIVL